MLGQPHDFAEAIAKVMSIQRADIRLADVEPVCRILETRRPLSDEDHFDLVKLIRKLAGRDAPGNPGTRKLAVRGSIKWAADTIKRSAEKDRKNIREQRPSARTPNGYLRERLQHHKQRLIDKGVPNAEHVDLAAIEREIIKPR